MWLQKLQRFFYGRYGTDKLNIFLLLMGLLFSILGGLFFLPLVVVADVLFVLALLRSFSRNIRARQQEYAAFLRIWTPVSAWFKLQKTKFDQRSQYKYFRCPHCRQQLRAPRGRGRIEVTCQKCHSVFQTKT